jgi:hypothetical protein
MSYYKTAMYAVKMTAFLVVLRGRYELFFRLNGHDLNTNEIIRSGQKKRQNCDACGRSLHVWSHLCMCKTRFIFVVYL